MNQLRYNALGLMSGTSLDGLDLAWVEFWLEEDSWKQNIKQAKTISYSASWRESLENAPLLSRKELQTLDANYGTWLGNEVCRFVDEFKISKLDFVASHGHTVHHQPDKKITVQVGNGPQLNQITGLPVVCDFRIQDVLLGGQGAPLVPIGDELLFRDFGACLNLGGFANISFHKGQRIAFDICPVNIVLNALVQKLGFPYDDGGKIAQRGSLIPSVLKQLNDLSFYEQTAPKSLGREWVVEEVFPLLLGEFETEDLLHTFCEHVAIQIGESCNDLIQKTVLVTGGGAFNGFLLERIKHHSTVKFIVPKPELVNYKEALIFAFLGLLRLTNQPNCLASVTGAKSDHSSGRIYR